MSTNEWRLACLLGVAVIVTLIFAFYAWLDITAGEEPDSEHG